ncbi:MAG: hypothetical protein SWE60_15815 [Thermodesulfobacteriota bacterium]|nr:hypothetical protein [Thermodesulfobacteriota bacterium]
MFSGKQIDECFVLRDKASQEALLSEGLIEKAAIEANLNLIPLKDIRRKLREYQIKGAQSKAATVTIAARTLPDATLREMVGSEPAYVLTPVAIEELKLLRLDLPFLHDEARFYGVPYSSEEEAMKSLRQIQGGWCEPDELIEIKILLLNKARRAADYESYLNAGLPPAEGFLARAYASLGDFHSAYSEIKTAVELDTKQRGPYSLTHIDHLGALLIQQLRLEIILSRHLDPCVPELRDKVTETEKKLAAVMAVSDRESTEGVTQFLCENYERIFEVFGDCSRDSENGYREAIGVPRIGEGWVSEIELLNLVRKILPKDKVIHQASPEWLGLQRFDIYVPKHKLAIEYQGSQHYKPVPFFGGEEGFLKRQELDRRKAGLCAKNGVTLMCFRYDEPLTREMVETRIKTVAQS